MLIGKGTSDRSGQRDYRTHPLELGIPPGWASEWGEDRFGPFVAFDVRGVQQRLRWIPAGRFVMGSPKDEPGRYDDEGPQHEVTVGEGYFLADTPCTQALWQAVMGDNPSRFQSPQRPVERVSWQDSRRFLRQLNTHVPGLSATLPTETQWEYACRAGTTTATYGGPTEIALGPEGLALDRIAWHGGNSRLGFELEAIASPGGREVAREHSGGTHPVAQKGANSFGLYDMLGNVWEWCADAWDRDAYRPGADSQPKEPGLREERVIRGGSWSSYPRHVRAAYRRGWPTGSRANYTGLRLLRGPHW